MYDYLCCICGWSDKIQFGSWNSSKKTAARRKRMESTEKPVLLLEEGIKWNKKMKEINFFVIIILFYSVRLSTIHHKSIKHQTKWSLFLFSWSWCLKWLLRYVWLNKTINFLRYLNLLRLIFNFCSKNFINFYYLLSIVCLILCKLGY